MNAPERIWAAPAFFNGQCTYIGGSWLDRVPTKWNHVTEYVRADRIVELEAEVARLREALDRIAKDGYGLQGVQEDAGGDANRYNYLAAEYWANEVKWRRSVARDALEQTGEHDK